MADNKMTYRQYLQHHADTHWADVKRQEAQALLNVVGDDKKLDGNFLTGEKHGFLGMQTREKQSNGFTSSAINNVINPWWVNSYNQYSNQWDEDERKGLHGNNTSPQPDNSANSAWVAQQAEQARNRAKNLAIVNENLRLMPNSLRRIDEAEKNKYAHIEDDYNRANGGLDNYWKQVQEDYNTARTQRLGNRRRQIGVADDDFKKQRDAYARYFARSGSGSSSTAQYAVPALLARAADKVRSSIEDNNAEKAREQETNYNRQGLDYRKQKDDILTNRERQKQEAKEYFAGKRSSHWDEVAKLERQKADARNLSTDAIMSAGNEAVRRAQEQADEAVRAGAMTDGITYKPIKYEETKQKDWTYDPTKTEIKKPEEEQKDDNSLYNKYFRDKEEEKKKKGWISATVN
ncbi:hypothetical protein EUA78_00565 [TM7 phylum sp. oral taxon 351]|nr:hypothetical protein EUA78_00565 [TM7 phylum sp. oral taxon 351]